MPRVNPQKRVAKALQKLVQGQRLVREAEKELRRTLQTPQKPRPATKEAHA